MASNALRFGPFEFRPETGELLRDGTRVGLQPQPARLLALLLARPGELVTREAIQQALWGTGTHVDFERSLNFCVAKLRSALGDDASSPRFVETVPTRGYRFIPAPASAPAPAPATRRANSVYSLYAVGLLLVVAAGIAAYAYWPRPLPKIVVVPFHNETGSPDLDRVAKGVSDAAVTRLATPARLPRMLVIGNASNLRFSFRPPDMKAIGDSLGAQYLLLGQLKQDDRHLRVVAHLIRVSDQTHLWARTFDSETLDLDRQSAIAEEVATAITSSISR